MLFHHLVPVLPPQVSRGRVSDVLGYGLVEVLLLLHWVLQVVAWPRHPHHLLGVAH